MQKDVFIVEGLGGAKTLSGEVVISGAKNAALPAFAAALLFTKPVILENIPKIEDVVRVRELLSALGISMEEVDAHTYTVSVGEHVLPRLDPVVAKRLRASIIFTGPLLARFGEVRFPHPGGCVIGPRPIDLFLSAYEALGARCRIEGDEYVLSAPEGLRGTHIFFKQQSVTATEAVLMAAVLAQGVTVLENVALEPEVTSVAEFLRENGAQIEGIGSSTLTITGGAPLSTEHPVYRCIPDRIEAGSFLLLGALAAESLTLTRVNPLHLRALTETLRSSGVDLSIGEDTITVRGTVPNHAYLPVGIKTHEYPGFPTDLQAPMLVYLTQVSGESLVFETVFENRLNYVEDLTRMGADIKVFNPHQALVNGPSALKGKRLESPDIRAGLAFLIAALVASGTSLVHNIYYIDRGYEHIEERLARLGARIRRDTISD